MKSSFVYKPERIEHNLLTRTNKRMLSATIKTNERNTKWDIINHLKNIFKKNIDYNTKNKQAYKINNPPGPYWNKSIKHFL